MNIVLVALVALIAFVLIFGRRALARTAVVILALVAAATVVALLISWRGEDAFLAFLIVLAIAAIFARLFVGPAPRRP